MTKNNFVRQHKEKKKLSNISKTILIFNLLAVLLLVCCYLSLFVSPAHFWPFAFFGLAYPLIVVLNIAFIIYWIIRGRWKFIISLVAVGAGWPVLTGFIQINFDKQELPGNDTSLIKVLSYNVRLFDLYNWTNNKKTRNEMLDFLNREKANILCLQEIYTDDDGEFLTLDTLVKSQPAKYFHIKNTKTLRNKNHWGIATFTTYPIVNRGSISFGEGVNNICIYTDIKKGSDTIRVYNMHLQSIHFREEDYKYLEEINKDKDAVELEGFRKIFVRLKLGFKKRSSQVDLVANHIQNSPYPLIVCGDFNDPPASYTYRKISSGLLDAFMESGNGLGRTYNGKFPSFRIDYILHSKSFDSYRFETLPEEYSDHNAITSYLKVIR